MRIDATRREFLSILRNAGVVSLGAAAVPRIFQSAVAADSTSAANRSLVVIQLAGGNDGLNTVVPYSDDSYQKARPGIGLKAGQVLKLNDQLGLHPSLEGLKELFDERRLAIIQGVGYPQPDRSHFRSLDIWHSAQPGEQIFEEGWLGRTLAATVDLPGMRCEGTALGMNRPPLALVSRRVASPTIQRVEDFQLKGAHADELSQKLIAASSSKSPSAELNFLRETSTTALVSANRLKSVSQNYRTSVSYPATGLARQLKLVAQMIAAELPTRIFFVSLDGFDTHAQQAGGHAALLAELSGAISAFTRDLQEHQLADRVATITYSEFGRRVQENGSLGTDHGAASMMFCVVPEGQGGFYGEHPPLTDLDDGDLKFKIDFRQVYATLLDRWLHVPSREVLRGQFDQLLFLRA